MREIISVPDMAEQIRVMHLITPKFGLSADSIPTLAAAYRDALKPYDREAVEGGASLWRKEHDKFPTPKGWRDSIAEWCKRNRNTSLPVPTRNAEGQDIVCRHCRSVARWAKLSHALPDGTVFPSARMLAVCDTSRTHPNPDAAVPKPPEFVDWLRSDAEVYEIIVERQRILNTLGQKDSPDVAVPEHTDWRSMLRAVNQPPRIRCGEPNL